VKYQHIFTRLYDDTFKKTVPTNFTYLLTPLSRVLLEKLTGFQLVKFPEFYGSRRFIHKCPPPVSILSQFNPVYTPTSHFLNICLNIILPSTPRSPHCSLSLRIFHQKPLQVSSFSDTRYMPRPSHSFRYLANFRK
jgi:hypothetical protein